MSVVARDDIRDGKAVHYMLNVLANLGNKLGGKDTPSWFVTIQHITGVSVMCSIHSDITLVLHCWLFLVLLTNHPTVSAKSVELKDFQLQYWSGFSMVVVILASYAPYNVICSCQYPLIIAGKDTHLELYRTNL